MIVVDASAVLEVLLQTRAAPHTMQRLFGRNEVLAAPHLVDVEVLQVLRRYAATRQIATSRAEEAIQVFHSIPIERYAHDLLLDRMWELRRNLTAHDAAYVSLAELLRAPLVTHDARLARASGHAAEIELIV